MVVLNWKTGIGNITLDPGSSILVPFQDLPGLQPVPLPADAIAQPDDYGIYFQVESIDATTGAVVFKVDSDGFKIPFGFTTYTTGDLINDDLIAIGYPPGVREDGTYINALSLTTIRLGGGHDTLTIAGAGITQSLSAEVNKEASAGYIFQSNIFAGAGDDVVRALMPWQSVFKGGSNTLYYDAIYGTDPGGGTTITLSDDLTLEEISFGDLIELKGSRFDWDIEFKDGNGDGDVSLASILDERDYIATSNNNRIYGFERLLFGDILFDLILARQQNSNAIFGQPDYYLNGAENQAPELNSTISQESGLWDAFRFNRTKLEGITGTATNPISVHTGAAGDTPFLVGALQFAALLTEDGDDIVEIGSADQATVDLGEGSDQLKVNGSVSRTTARGGAGQDNIILTSISNSTISGGSGADIVDVRASATASAFDGGADAGDTLLLPGPFADYALTASNSGGVVTFTDVFGNNFTGFQSIKFSDINLDALQSLTLSGPAAPVAEGATADYTIALAASGLARGESVAFALQLGNGTAQVSSDLAALVQSSLQAAAGIVLRNVSVDAATGLIRAIASASRNFSPAATIATLALPVSVDLQTEPDETFSLTLSDFVQAQTVTTTISNQDPLAIRLTGPGSVLEGATATPYTVSLDGVGLGAGASVSFSLDSASGSATEGLDFNALVAAGLTAATGITLSGISTAADGSISVTATNTSGVDLIADAALLTLKLKTANDAVVEGDESFDLRLSSSSTAVNPPTLSTTITDDEAPALKLTGSASIAEGAAAAYSLALDGVGLGAGRAVSFTLDSTSGSAAEGNDFSKLVFADLKPAAGVKLKRLSTDPLTKAVTISATNISGTDLATGAELLRVPIKTTNDRTAEGAETYAVTLSSNTASVAAPALTTRIKDDDQVAIRLKSKTRVREGDAASYAIGLDGVGLGSGRSISLSVNTAGESARQPTDFAPLLPGSFSAEAGVSLGSISTDPVTGALTLTVTNSSGEDLATNAQLLNFAVGTSNDAVVEGNETYAVKLSRSTAAVSTPTINTTITDDDAAVITLSGSASVQEGNTAAYAVSLDGVSLGAGQSVKLVLDTISGSATEGSDFAALVAAGLKAAPGLKLSDISIQASTKAVRLTVTNRSNADLAVGAPLLSFTLNTIDDSTVEVTEAYRVTLTSSTADVSSGSLTTTITDNDIATPVEPPGGGGGSNPVSPGNPFLNGGKPEDILDTIFGKGRPRVRRKAAADPIVESRQRLIDTRSRRSADRIQNGAAMEDSLAISSIGSDVTVATRPWQDPRLDGSTALPLSRTDNGTLPWL